MESFTQLMWHPWVFQLSGSRSSALGCQLQLRGGDASPRGGGETAVPNNILSALVMLQLTSPISYPKKGWTHVHRKMPWTSSDIPLKVSEGSRFDHSTVDDSKIHMELHHLNLPQKSAIHVGIQSSHGSFWHLGLKKICIYICVCLSGKWSNLTHGIGPKRQGWMGDHHQGWMCFF